MQIESQIQTELQKVEYDDKLSIIESKDCNFTMPCLTTDIFGQRPTTKNQQSDFMNLSSFLDFVNDALERGMDTICITTFHNCFSPHG